MEIKREKYLNALKDREWNGLVKVITGCRRSGKSYLLFDIFCDYLSKKGINNSEIVKLALDEIKNDSLRDPHALYDFLESKVKSKNKKYYILLDEIQFVPRFEEVLNSLVRLGNVDVYVTGSNSKLLSKDIITSFRGRGDEIRVRPLSFSEFIVGYDGDERKAWQDYLLYGGLPRVLALPTPELKMKYLEDLFEETYLKDIIERYNLRTDGELGELVNILASAIGSLTNPSKLERTFKTIKKSDITDKTIRSYIDYLEDAFLLNGAMRYDIKGKKYIDTPIKYYFEDLGLRNARLNFRQSEFNHLMENAVYNELLYRGFKVDVGVVEVLSTNKNGERKRSSLEIDFIANQGDKKYYLQSAFSMPDLEKVKQEEKPLLSAGDGFKKIIITGDNIAPSYNENGILMINIIDFLLDENSLDR